MKQRVGTQEEDIVLFLPPQFTEFHHEWGSLWQISGGPGRNQQKLTSPINWKPQNFDLPATIWWRDWSSEKSDGEWFIERRPRKKRLWSYLRFWRNQLVRKMQRCEVMSDINFGFRLHLPVPIPYSFVKLCPPYMKYLGRVENTKCGSNKTSREETNWREGRAVLSNKTWDKISLFPLLSLLWLPSWTKSATPAAIW